MKLLASAALAAVLAFGAAAAQATVYVGSRAVGDATAAFSITTDGVFGVLSTGDITDFAFTITDPLGSASGTFADSAFILDGSSLAASATQLTWDFAGNGAMLLETQSFPLGAYCIDGANAAPTCDFNAPSETILFEGDSGADEPIESRANAGVVVLATLSTGGVPEPAAWALMIAGFGLTGAALRGRRASALRA